jgi:SAM-dependent methyltransferase
MFGITANDSSGSRQLKLHLGCELNTPSEWINVDGSWGAWLAKYQRLRTFLKLSKLFSRQLLIKDWNPDVLVHDLRKSLPFPDNSIAAIYACHVLEHLYLTESQKLLKECYRIMKPDGIIRIVVPDLRAIVLEYSGGKEEKTGGRLTLADRLNQRLSLRSETPPVGNLIYKIYSIVKDFHSHKWMYDADSLSYHVKQAGFTNIRVTQAHESLIEDIEKIEQMDRIVNGAGICVEAVKSA